MSQINVSMLIPTEQHRLLGDDLEEWMATDDGRPLPLYVEREFWTARQRQAHALHEISYRACFKPQLPSYFITRLTQPGDIVYDPFSGRGTTALEAALLGRAVVANDINPLSEILARPRIEVPTLQHIEERLHAIDFDVDGDGNKDMDLSMFYHERTEAELRALRAYLATRRASGDEDECDRWIRMVATNRLSGHSPGFFSVYSLPPNQAASPERQRRSNERLGLVPEYRDVRALILAKSRQLQKGVTSAERKLLQHAASTAKFLTGRAQKTPQIPDESIALTVTSPPFLDVVQYPEDNWLRCWFNEIDVAVVAALMSASRSIEQWQAEMAAVFSELYRITRPGGHVAFEVGEVRGGRIKLDEVVVPLGEAAGFKAIAVLVNRQQFTKTSNIWGVHNNSKGTNSNRIVILRKAA